MNARKPSVAALLLALVPFVAMCFTVSLWDRIEPMPLGIPFNLFWLLGVISLSLAIFSSSTLVSLLLTGYAGVTQFFPGVVLGLYSKRVTARAVFVGMIAGVGTALFLMLTHRDPLYGVSAGFVALCLNFVITTAVSLLSRKPT